MVMVEVNLSSEITGLINFLICDILIMAYILYVSSVIAGSVNHRQITKGNALNLSAFDFPHIGGGLVMSKRRTRFLLIFLRTSALAAVAISNFGLEGRTKPVTTLTEGLVRRPGLITELNYDTLFDATERRKRCGKTRGSELRFGAVIDGNCYPDLDTEVHIHSISMVFERFKTSALNCRRFPNKTIHSTTYNCDDVDISCLGTKKAQHQKEKGRCRSVLYASEGVWLCPFEGARPEIENDFVQCRLMKADRRDIKLWTEIYRTRTEDMETAMFGAAYGVEERKLVRIPVDDRNVTVVTLFWFIPAAWEVFVVIVVSFWAISLRTRGAVSVANDERGLLRLINRRVDLETVKMEEWFSNPDPLHVVQPSRADDV